MSCHFILKCVFWSREILKHVQFGRPRVLIIFLLANFLRFNCKTYTKMKGITAKYRISRQTVTYTHKTQIQSYKAYPSAYRISHRCNPWHENEAYRKIHSYTKRKCFLLTLLKDVSREFWVITPTTQGRPIIKGSTTQQLCLGLLDLYGTAL